MVQESAVRIGDKKSQRHVCFATVHTTREMADSGMLNIIHYVYLFIMIYYHLTKCWTLGKKHDSICGTFCDGRHNAH